MKFRYPKINMFKPYFEWRHYPQMNDWFEFKLCWCNYLIFVFSIMGYGFQVGIRLYLEKVAKHNYEKYGVITGSDEPTE